MRCSSDVLKKTSPLDVFGDVSGKVKHLNDASNDVSPPALVIRGRHSDKQELVINATSVGDKSPLFGEFPF